MAQSLRNVKRNILIYDQFNGGISPSIKGGGSFRFARGADIHRDPSYFKPLPKAVKDSGSTVTSLIIDAVRVPNGDTYFLGQDSKIYKRTAAGVWSLDQEPPQWLLDLGARQADSMFYWPSTDYIYFVSGSIDLLGRSIGRYGPMTGTPTIDWTYYTDAADQVNLETGTSTAESYTLKETIQENDADRWQFTPERDGMTYIEVDPFNYGGGDWTLTIHDDDDNVIESVTLPAADVGTFYFDPLPKLLIGGTYHVHLTTSSAGTDAVSTNVSEDFSTAEIYTIVTRIMPSYNRSAPIQSFTSYLAVANSRYVATFDGLLRAGKTLSGTPGKPTTSWNFHRLEFPAGYEIVAQAKWDEYIVLGLEYQGENPEKHSAGQVVFWDGFSSRFNFAMDVNEGGVQSFLLIKNTLCFIAGNRGEVFRYTGGSYDSLFQFPKTSDTEYVRSRYPLNTIYQGQPCFGLAYETDNSDFEHGVYTYSRKDSRYPAVLNYAWPISTGNRTGTDIKIGLVKAFGTELFIGWEDGGTYGVDIVESGNDPQASVDMEGNAYDNDDPWHEKFCRVIRVDHQPLKTGDTVSIGYDINQSGTFTMMDTANSTVGSTETRFKVKKLFKDIQWKVSLGATVNGVQVNDVVVDTEPREGSELV